MEDIDIAHEDDERDTPRLDRLLADQPPNMLVPVHPRRRWPWLAAGAAVAVGAATATALLMLPAHHGLTPACQAAVERQNQFVASAVALGYPDVDIATVMAIQAQDLKILNDGMKVCPGNTEVHTLPDSSS